MGERKNLQDGKNDERCSKAKLLYKISE